MEPVSTTLQVIPVLEFSVGADSPNEASRALTKLQSQLNEILTNCNDSAATVTVSATTTSAGVYWLGTVTYMAGIKPNDLPRVTVHFGVEYADGVDATGRANNALTRLQELLNDQLDQETPGVEPVVDIKPFATKRGLFFLGMVTYSPIL